MAKIANNEREEQVLGILIFAIGQRKYLCLGMFAYVINVCFYGNINRNIPFNLINYSKNVDVDG